MMKTVREALIARVMQKDGPPGFQRQFQKHRADLADTGLEELINRLLDIQALDDETWDKAEKLMADPRIKITTVLDDDYPAMLKNLYDPPMVLFYCGELQTLHRPSISIVGSRSSTTYGLQIARELAGELARLGFVIVSGLARGIDGAAHRATLSVGGRTAGILGSGIDRIYPEEHRDLALEIVHHQGVIVSEFTPGMAPKAFHFPIRNRIISGLCHATIVVEAREKSGSLITARHCLDQGRELFAVPGPIHSASSRGPNRLIHDGEARMLLSVQDVLEELAPLLGMAAAHEKRMRHSIDDPVAREIYNRLDTYEPMSIEVLAADLAIEVGILSGHLVELECRGLVERQPGHCFLRNPLIQAT